MKYEKNSYCEKAVTVFYGVYFGRYKSNTRLKIVLLIVFALID